jgi:uncharacterized protein YndB with AHSA1/START domain
VLKKILAALAAVIVILAVVIALRPAEFRVDRSLAVAAPPEAVFPHVNDLRKWTEWSPWEKLDPAMERSYEGAPEGAGAHYAWKGNSDVGHGRMEIAESEAPRRIRIDLEFIEPFTSTATAEFTFQPESGGTVVTWAIRGKNNFVAKAMHMMMDVNGMIGAYFEKGLANLKSIAESGQRQ